MTLAERIVVGCIGCAVIGAVASAASDTLHPPPGASAAFELPSARDDPHGAAFRAGAGQRAAIDPLRPPGLPAGMSIDPKTGLMQGADLRPGEGEVALGWQRLAAADGVPAADALPADLRELEGGAVVMAGFLMPLYEIERMRSFLLVGSHYACCFGKPPGLGGMVMVHLAADASPMDALLEPLRVAGTLRIRERRRGEAADAPLLLLFELQDARAERLAR